MPLVRGSQDQYEDCSGAAPIRAVVVDTRPTAQIGAMTILSACWPNWEVTGASSQAEFAGLTPRHHFDLVLTDLHLHDHLEGLEVCRAAKKAEEQTSTLVFAEEPDPDVILSTITSRVVDGIVQRTACLPSLIRAIKSVLQGFQAWQLEPPGETSSEALTPGVKGLTRRERTILALLCRRWSNREIARELNLAEQTVKNNLSTIYGKLGVGGRTELYASVRHNELWLHPSEAEAILS